MKKNDFNFKNIINIYKIQSRIKMFLKVSSYMRNILIKEEKLRILKKIEENSHDKIKMNELKKYLKYLEEQSKIYPNLK